MGALYDMTKTEAIAKIEASLLGEPQVITPKNSTYEIYVKERSIALIETVIEPKPITVNAACFPQYYLELYQNSSVWVIANSGDNWLLTLEGKPEFALAFGGNPNNLTMLGFSSSDALAEWLG
jgi:hypothetical protein